MPGVVMAVRQFRAFAMTPKDLSTRAASLDLPMPSGAQV
jgi:hypothetical protein